MLGLVFTRSCDPVVTQFSVTPLHVCSGRTVTISWKTIGETTTLTADHPVVPPLEKVASSGQITVLVSQTTTFTIESILKGEKDNKRIEVELIPRQGATTLIGAQSVSQLESAVSTFEIKQSEWDEAVRVDTITNVSDRPIKLFHAGSVIELGSGETTESLAGSMVGGIWKLTAELQAGESSYRSDQPNQDGRRWQPLPYLAIEVNTSCQYP
jgi:hypothetical protein